MGGVVVVDDEEGKDARNEDADKLLLEASEPTDATERNGEVFVRRDLLHLLELDIPT